MIMEELKERLLLYINSLGITKSEFERKSGLSNGYLNKLKGYVGQEKLNCILEAYPDLNRVWLLTGEGEMTKSAQSVGNISNSNVSGVNVNGQEIHINPNAYDTLLKIVENNQRTTEKFQEQIDRLLTLLENKQ